LLFYLLLNEFIIIRGLIILKITYLYFYNIGIFYLILQMNFKIAIIYDKLFVLIDFIINIIICS